MNSYQVLEQETNAAIAEGNETKMNDIIRRIGNLMVSPTCAGYPWNTLIERIKPLLKDIDREKTLSAILRMRDREADNELVESIVKDTGIPLDDISQLSDDFMKSYSNAGQKGKKRQHV